MRVMLCSANTAVTYNVACFSVSTQILKQTCTDVFIIEPSSVCVNGKLEGKSLLTV